MQKIETAYRLEDVLWARYPAGTAGSVAAEWEFWHGSVVTGIHCGEEKKPDVVLSGRFSFLTSFVLTLLCGEAVIISISEDDGSVFQKIKWTVNRKDLLTPYID